MISPVRMAGLTALLAFALPGLAAISPSPTPAKDTRMAWWRDAKFGMFVHWGLYAITARGEWEMRNQKIPLAEYRRLATEFNPTAFDADAWAALARDAGMKYLVLTTKHHDGFAMFRSEASDYNIVDATAFHRDPLKELSVALPKYGLRLGTYYSILADWGHPGGGAGCPKWDPAAQDGTYDEYLAKVAIPQVRELLSNYGPIGVLWFDNDGSPKATPEQVARIAAAVRLQPDVIVTPRLIGFPGDFETVEGRLPMRPPAGDWELCTRTNANWGYTAAPARPLRDLLLELAAAWGMGGNVLLNVGPDRTGAIPADSAQRLREIGAWMKTNGEAVYGSQRGPFDHLPWGWSTRRGNTLYLLVRDWPADGRVRLPMATPVRGARLLAAPDTPVTVEAKDGLTLVQGPAEPPDPNVSVVALDLAGPVPPRHSLTAGARITASEKTADAARTTDPASSLDWRVPSASGWIEADLGAPRTFTTLRLSTPYTDATRITLEAREGEAWKPIWSVDSPREKTFTVQFPPR